MPHKAILIGATGLIGSNLLQLIIENSFFSEVLVFTRSALSVSSPKLKQQIIDFDNLKQYTSLITADVIFCCIGSTRNKTPDKTHYKKVDVDYPLAFARIGVENNVKQFHIITSLNANFQSSNSYLKLKGQLEEELKKLNYTSLHIYQPSYLEGLRKEIRIDDKIMRPLMKLINPMLIGSLQKYRSIKASDVAQAMLNQSVKNLKGTFTYPSNRIKELA